MMATKLWSALDCILRSSGFLNDDTYLQKLSSLLTASQFELIDMQILFEKCRNSDILLDFVLDLSLKKLKMDSKADEASLSFINDLCKDKELLRNTAKQSIPLLELLRELMITEDKRKSEVIADDLLWQVSMSLWPLYHLQSHFWRRSFAALQITLINHCSDQCSKLSELLAIHNVDAVEQVLLPLLRQLVERKSDNAAKEKMVKICVEYLEKVRKFGECEFRVQFLLDFGLSEENSEEIDDFTQSIFENESCLRAMTKEIDFVAQHKWNRVNKLVRIIFEFLMDEDGFVKLSQIEKLKAFLLFQMTKVFLRDEFLRKKIFETSLFWLRKLIGEKEKQIENSKLFFYTEKTSPIPNSVLNRDIRHVLNCISLASEKTNNVINKREELVNYLIIKGLIDHSLVLNTRRQMLQLASKLIAFAIDEQVVQMLITNCHSNIEWQLLDGIFAILKSLFISDSKIASTKKQFANKDFLQLLMHFGANHESPFVRASSFELLASINIEIEENLIKLLKHVVYDETEAIVRRSAFDLINTIHNSSINNENLTEQSELFRVMSEAMRLELDEESCGKILAFWMNHIESVITYHKINDKEALINGILEKTCAFEALMAAMNSRDEMLRRKLHNFLTVNFQKDKKCLISKNSDFESSLAIFLANFDAIRELRAQDDVEAVLDDIILSYNNSNKEDEVIIDCY